MSLETWIAEFYPTPASDFLNPLVRNPIDAAEHSLRKWRGTLPENLKKHGVIYDKNGALREKGGDEDVVFDFDSDSCSLCNFSTDKDGYIDCDLCPLKAVLGRDCTTGEVIDGEYVKGVYSRAYHGKIGPLIEALERAVEYAKQQCECAADAKHTAMLMDAAESPQEAAAILHSSTQGT